MEISFVDNKKDLNQWAKKLDISKEAIEVYADSDVIDLHVDSFIWKRILNYDLFKRHENKFYFPPFLNHLDFPRALEAGLTGAMWSITTNPLKSDKSRQKSFLQNFKKIHSLFESTDNKFKVVRNIKDYQKNKEENRHSVFLSIQGGNSLGDDFNVLDLIDDSLIRVTLLHFTKSSFGFSSVPKKGETGLTTKGLEFVEKLNSKKIFVDLAHISEKGFFDALEVHSKSLPPIVTHTGVKDLCSHWRNLTNKQIKMISDRGGVIGVMFQKYFLDDNKSGRTIERVVDHIEHIINIGGEDCPAIGSDFDGMIMPPKGLESCLDLPKLSQEMLNRKWSHTRIQKVLGKNFLNSFSQLRP